jgi:RNA polymerase sigma-70 factor (ECF subfamily)
MKPRPEAAARRPPLVLAAAEPSRPDDHEIVRGLRAGEAWAATAVWNAHAPRVFRVAARVFGSDNDAEDITQDVFARVFSGIDSLRDPGALGSFVFSVALRMVKRELQRRRVRRILRLSDTGRLPDVPVDGAESEARDALAWLYVILDQLSAEERTAFVLRHVETMGLAEIAEAMGLSLATVKRRLDRACEAVALADKDGTFATYGLNRGHGGPSEGPPSTSTRKEGDA